MSQPLFSLLGLSGADEARWPAGGRVWGFVCVLLHSGDYAASRPGQDPLCNVLWNKRGISDLGLSQMSIQGLNTRGHCTDGVWEPWGQKHCTWNWGALGPRESPANLSQVADKWCLEYTFSLYLKGSPEHMAVNGGQKGEVPTLVLALMLSVRGPSGKFQKSALIRFLLYVQQTLALGEIPFQVAGRQVKLYSIYAKTNRVWVSCTWVCMVCRNEQQKAGRVYLVTLVASGSSVGHRWC